jgi:serine/threonine protein kinase
VLRAPAEAAATVLRPEEPEPPAEAGEPVALPLAERLPSAYSVRRVLGMGGMGAVLLAHHREWNIEVVLKVPRPEILDDPAAAPRIRREAEAWTGLGLHPHIVYCYFVLPVDEVPVVVIEHLTGGNLRQRRAAGQGDSLRGTLDLAIQLCHGLEHAHQAGLVHRDIKPENLLLDADGTLKVTDFGISLVEGAARLGGPAAHDGALTMAGLGTRGYMAPEQWMDAHKVDARADIFAVGVCLYEWLSGARPYDGTAGARLEAPDPPRSLPTALRALMRQSVDWYRDARPASVREVRERLSDVYRAEFGAPSGFTQLPQVEPEADGWNNRGVSFLELARPDDALDSFGKALKANPYHFEAARNRALLRWRRGEIDDMEACSTNWRLLRAPTHGRLRWPAPISTRSDSTRPKHAARWLAGRACTRSTSPAGRHRQLGVLVPFRPIPAAWRRPWRCRAMAVAPSPRASSVWSGAGIWKSSSACASSATPRDW